jgi:hypothetical protein
VTAPPLLLTFLPPALSRSPLSRCTANIRLKASMVNIHLLSLVVPHHLGNSTHIHLQASTEASTLLRKVVLLHHNKVILLLKAEVLLHHNKVILLLKAAVLLHRNKVILLLKAVCNHLLLQQLQQQPTNLVLV